MLRHLEQNAVMASDSQLQLQQQPQAVPAAATAEQLVAELQKQLAQQQQAHEQALQQQQESFWVNLQEEVDIRVALQTCAPQIAQII